MVRAFLFLVILTFAARGGSSPICAQGETTAATQPPTPKSSTPATDPETSADNATASPDEQSFLDLFFVAEPKSGLKLPKVARVIDRVSPEPQKRLFFAVGSASHRTGRDKPSDATFLVLDHMKCAAVSVGTYDLYSGIDELERVARSGTPLICANLYSGDSRVFAPLVEIEQSGLTLVVIGVASGFKPRLSQSQYRLQAPLLAVQDCLAQLAERTTPPDLIIVLCDGSSAAREIAAVDGIHGVITNGSNCDKTGVQYVDETALCRVTRKTANVLGVRLPLDPQKLGEATLEILKHQHRDGVDPEIQALLMQLHGR